MRKQNRSCGLLATAKSRYHFDTGLHQTDKYKRTHKRGYSAEGHSLLTSALRPRLFGVGNRNAKSISYSCAKNRSSNNSQFRFSREKLAFVIPIISVTVLSIFSLLHNNANVSATSATLTIPDAVSVNVNPTLNDGFAESTPGEVSVSTSNLAGYTLSIKAKDSANGNSLVNTNNSNAKLTSITTELSTEQYKTGDYVNTWGFKPDYVDSSPNTSYRPGPDANGIVLAKTNSDSALDNINVAIAAKVDSNTITGNYTNTFVLTAVPNEAKYNITYNLNGGSGGPGNITETGDIGSSTEIAINGNAPTPPSGKDFLGWCSKNPGTSDTCDGVLVQPGKSLYLCKCDLNITLYAMYGVKKPTQNGDNCSHSGYSGSAKYYADLCWMWQDVSGSFNWGTALNSCPTGWRLPTQQEFQSLIDTIGTGNQLYNAGWRHSTGYYWSSNSVSRDAAYYLRVTDTSAYVSNYGGATIYPATSSTLGVRCVVVL